MGGDPVRRGQIFSMDALVAAVLVIMLIGTVSATSENLKEGITSLVGWYERTNIADNMLDVIVKTPGDPENWSLNPESVVIPGLRSNSSVGMGLDYQKVYALFHGIETNDTHIISSLYRLADNKDFQLAIFLRKNILDVLLEYQLQQGNWLEICNVKELVEKLGNPSNSPALIYCPTGEFRFDHSEGVSYYNYTNNKYICVNSSTYIGNNFRVIAKDYMGVNGNLEVGSNGGLNVSDLYLEGNGSVGSNGELKAFGDIHVGGSFDIASSGNVVVDGSAYFYDEVTVERTAYLTVGKNLYIDGPLWIYKNGYVKVGKSAYINDYVEVENGAHFEAGKDIYINGDLRSLEYSAEITTGGDLYIKGSATVKGSIKTGGGMYVNGPMLIDYGSTVTVGGDMYVNGTLTVKGTLTVHGNLYINGDLIIYWNKEVNVDGDLYLTGSIKNLGKLNVKGTIHENIKSLPWDESKLQFTIDIPPMKHAPCLLGAVSFSVLASVNVNMSYSPAEFYSDWENLAVINGTLVNGSDIITRSKLRSPWVEHEERNVILERFKYRREYNITDFSRATELYVGKLVNPIPPQATLAVQIPGGSGNLTIISIFFKGDTWGYSVISILERNSKIYHFEELTEYVGTAKVTKKCSSITVTGNTVVIPWECMVPSASYLQPTSFMVSLYNVQGFSWVHIADRGSVDVYLEPVYSSAKIELWVWDDS